MLMECEMVKLTGNNMQLPEKVKHMLRDPAIPHRGVYPEQKTEVERSGCRVHSDRVSAGG